MVVSADLPEHGESPAGLRGDEVETTRHVWDEDLTELNNPLPRWWVTLFYVTLVFGVLYLMLYPGLGSNSMFLGWTQIKEYDDEMARAEARYGPLYERYLDLPIEQVAGDPKAMRMGERLFASYCTVCHGSDAGGVRGFPNLRDDSWQWGGEPEQIRTSILAGRTAVMPGWRDALGGDSGVDEVVAYVLSLSGRGTGAAAGRRSTTRCAWSATVRTAPETPLSGRRVWPTTCGSTADRTMRCATASRWVARVGCRPTGISWGRRGCMCSRPGSGASRTADSTALRRLRAVVRTRQWPEVHAAVEITQDSSSANPVRSDRLLGRAPVVATVARGDSVGGRAPRSPAAAPAAGPPLRVRSPECSRDADSCGRAGPESAARQDRGSGVPHPVDS